MREKINYLRHLFVLFLTIVIFFLGVFIGGIVEDKRVENLYTQLQEQDLAYQNVVTESNFISFLLEDFQKNNQPIDRKCEVIKGTFFTSIENLDNSRLKLESYVATASVNQQEYYRLQSHYSNLQATYWMLANEILNLCPESNFQTILYFFDDREKCPACQDQGVILSHIKKQFQDDVLIFSFDVQREGVVKLFLQNFNIFGRETPVLVIGEELFGFSSNQEILNKLCQKNPQNSNC